LRADRPHSATGQPAFSISLQGWIERALLYFEKIVGCTLDYVGERVTVHRRAPQGLEDHHFEGAG
jgi:hypothetical protein